MTRGGRVKISDEAVGVAAKAYYGPTPHGESRMRRALEAVAPQLLQAAWADGHESGFWNGRESAGSEDMELCGVEHAEANNPYRAGSTFNMPTTFSLEDEPARQVRYMPAPPYGEADHGNH